MANERHKRERALLEKTKKIALTLRAVGSVFDEVEELIHSSDESDQEDTSRDENTRTPKRLNK